MNTKELIEELKWVMDVEGKPYQEIIKRLEDYDELQYKILDGMFTTLKEIKK